MLSFALALVRLVSAFWHNKFLFPWLMIILQNLVLVYRRFPHFSRSFPHLNQVNGVNCGKVDLNWSRVYYDMFFGGAKVVEKSVEVWYDGGS